MKQKCLLIKIKDNKRFLTHEKNLTSLVEFAKTFGAEIYLVEPQEKQKILDLKPLTAAICSADYDDDLKYKKLERVFPKAERKRQNILEGAGKIRKFIQRRLLSGKTISLKELKQKYKARNLTDACLCNHLSATRKGLVLQGHTFQKVAAGEYSLVK